MSTPPKPALLSLPLEIRLQIWALARHRQYVNVCQCSFRGRQDIPCNFSCCVRMNPSADSGLLLVNRQIHAEASTLPNEFSAAIFMFCDVSCFECYVGTASDGALSKISIAAIRGHTSVWRHSNGVDGHDANVRSSKGFDLLDFMDLVKMADGHWQDSVLEYQKKGGQHFMFFHLGHVKRAPSIMARIFLRGRTSKERTYTLFEEMMGAGDSWFGKLGPNDNTDAEG